MTDEAGGADVAGQVPWPFELRDRTAEQLRWMRRALELLTTVRMVRRDLLTAAAADRAWDAACAGLTVPDVGRLLVAMPELLDRALVQAGVPDEVTEGWLDLLGRSLASAEQLAGAVSGQ